MASASRMFSDCRIWIGRQRDRFGLLRQHLRNERVLRDSRGVVNIRIHAPLGGLGSHFNMAVLMLTACERRDLVPHFRFTSPQYGAADGSMDWLAHLYHQPRSSGASGGPELLITRWADMSSSFRRRYPANRAAISRLVHSHFTLTPEIAARVGFLASTLFQGEPTLGVHFRGTDKATEARVVPVSEVVASIRKLLMTPASMRRIFVATDSVDFLQALGSELDAAPVVSVPAVERTTGSEGIHFKPSNNRMARAEQGLIDALLLARCSYLLKTESGLSQWTTLLNPELPVLQLNARYNRPIWASWFPLDLFETVGRSAQQHAETMKT